MLATAGHLPRVMSRAALLPSLLLRASPHFVGLLDASPTCHRVVRALIQRARAGGWLRHPPTSLIRFALDSEICLIIRSELSAPAHGAVTAPSLLVAAFIWCRTECPSLVRAASSRSGRRRAACRRRRGRSSARTCRSSRPCRGRCGRRGRGAWHRRGGQAHQCVPRTSAKPLQSSEHRLASYGVWWSYARRARLTRLLHSAELAPCQLCAAA